MRAHSEHMKNIIVTRRTARTSTPKTWIVIVDRALDGAPVYAGELDGIKCGVNHLENASRFTKIGAKRVLAGYPEAVSHKLAFVTEVSLSGGLTDERCTLAYGIKLVTPRHPMAYSDNPHARNA